MDSTTATKYREERNRQLMAALSKQALRSQEEAYAQYDRMMGVTSPASKITFSLNSTGQLMIPPHLLEAYEKMTPQDQEEMEKHLAAKREFLRRQQSQSTDQDGASK